MQYGRASGLYFPLNIKGSHETDMYMLRNSLHGNGAWSPYKCNDIVDMIDSTLLVSTFTAILECVYRFWIDSLQNGEL